MFADRNANGEAGREGADRAVEAPDFAPPATLADEACKLAGNGDKDGAAEAVDAENEKENGAGAEGSVEAAGAAAIAGASKN